MAYSTKSVSSRTLAQVQRALPQQMSYIRQLKQTIKERLEEKQKEMLAKFDKHPVTQEIAGGASATNISGTLGGIGNLFTYIGFDAGDKPLSALRELLEKYEISFHHIKSKSVVSIELPTKEELFKATPMPWATGRSWAKGIETGISGLGRYLSNSRSPRSRSGKGIQVKGQIRTGKFHNVSYLTLILKDYYKSIEKLEKGDLT
mgnify:CR=1 FL=1